LLSLRYFHVIAGNWTELWWDERTAGPSTAFGAMKLRQTPLRMTDLGDDRLGDDSLGDDSLGDDSLGDDRFG
jgi:hypothetical protein